MNSIEYTPTGTIHSPFTDTKNMPIEQRRSDDRLLPET